MISRHSSPHTYKAHSTPRLAVATEKTCASGQKTPAQCPIRRFQYPLSDPASTVSHCMLGTRAESNEDIGSGGRDVADQVNARSGRVEARRADGDQAHPSTNLSPTSRCVGLPRRVAHELRTAGCRPVETTLGAPRHVAACPSARAPQARFVGMGASARAWAPMSRPRFGS